jgi:hypothetical protein
MVFRSFPAAFRRASQLEVPLLERKNSIRETDLMNAAIPLPPFPET